VELVKVSWTAVFTNFDAQRSLFFGDVIVFS